MRERLTKVEERHLLRLYKDTLKNRVPSSVPDRRAVWVRRPERGIAGVAGEESERNMATNIGQQRESRLVKAILEADVPENVKRNAQSIIEGCNLNGRRVGLMDLAHELARQAKAKVDYVVDSKAIQMSRNGAGPVALTFPAPPAQKVIGFEPTGNCHGQLSAKTGVPWKYYQRMQEEKPELLCQNLNTWLGDDPDRRQIRTLDGRARAFVSERYRSIDNADLFFAAVKEFSAKGCEVVRADLSDDHFRVAAVSPDVKASIPFVPGVDDHKRGNWDLFGGVSVSNSETGCGTLQVEGFCFEVWCLNGVMQEKAFKRVHLGEKLEAGIYRDETISQSTKAIWMQAQDTIAEMLTEVHVRTMADKMGAAKGIPIKAKPTLLHKGSWTGLGVTQEERDAILEHLGCDGNGWNQYGLQSAMTALGRDALDGDRRTELERLGGWVGGMEEKEFNGLVEQLCVVPRGARA